MLQMKIARPIHSKRGLLQILQIKKWMEIFLKIQAQYSIQPCNTYNMDKKEVMMSRFKNVGVICKKIDILTNLIHSGNRKLTLILKCISAIEQSFIKRTGRKFIGAIGCSDSE